MAANASFARQIYSVILWFLLTMSISTQSCYICREDESMPPIYLPDETPVFVGRSVATQITDIKCSKQQVWLYASYADEKVFVKQIGSHSSGFNGFKTLRNVKFIAKHNDCIEILYNKYRYRIEFNPPPKEKVDSINLKKRVHESSSENEDIGLKNGLENTKKSKLEDNGSESNMENREVASSSKKPDDIESSECNDEAKPTEKEPWEDIDRDLLIYTSKGVVGRSKIAAYDMDGTLIKTQSGYVFPKDHNDWQIIYSEVPSKLKQLFKDGYKIVIFTNQGFLGLGKWKPEDFKVKIEKVVARLGVPIQVFIATGKTMHRKPLTGMWDSLVNDKNDGIIVDKDSSFFVGDAAGRPKDWAPKKKKDHSRADRLLALNLGLKFETPEEHFLGHKPAPWEQPKFDPKSLDENGKVTEPPGAKLVSGEQEVIILVGGPGSGKSHFASTHLPNYVRINRDTLGTWQKCISSLEQALSEGKSAVVDNTNPDPSVRKKYIDFAKAQGVPVRCFLMTTDFEHTKHNNKFRQLTDASHDVISEAILHTYKKNFKPPTLDEGYTEIVNINFVPKFKNEKEKKLYQMYLLEK